MNTQKKIDEVCSYRGLPPVKKGQACTVDGKAGTIEGGNSGCNFNVQFPDYESTSNCHPYWRMIILNDDGSILYEHGKPKYYAIGDAETLSATTIEEAVEEFLSNHEGLELADDQVVQGYNPIILKPSCQSLDSGIETMIENLDENYGCPEESSDYSLSDRAQAVFDELKRLVALEYPVWRCESVGEPIAIKLSDHEPEAV